MQEELLYLAGLEASAEDEALDYVRIKRCYPKEVAQYNEIIEQECDKLEYDGSPMYAQIVDQSAIERVADRITTQCLNCGQGSAKTGYGPYSTGWYNRDSRTCSPGKPCRNGIYPLILTMLTNEMYVRRCRRCRRDRMFVNIY